MSMCIENVQSEEEIQTKTKWPDVTSQGKVALKKIQHALATQVSEVDFRKEVMEALLPVFKEVYSLVKSNITGYEAFLDQFPSLHDLKQPVWANMFDTKTFNADSTSNGNLKRLLTDMEVQLKFITASMPTTDTFIQVIFIIYLKNNSSIELSKLLTFFPRQW